MEIKQISKAETEPDKHSLSTYDVVFLCFYFFFIISFMFISETIYPSESSDGFAATIVYFFAVAIVSVPVCMLAGLLITCLKRQFACNQKPGALFFLVISAVLGAIICGGAGFIISAQSAFSDQIITIASISGGVSGAMAYLLS